MSVLGWIIYIIVVVGIGYGGGKLIGNHQNNKEYGPKWEAFGRDDALAGHPRFEAGSFLQKHYDRGYNAVINAKEEAL